MLWASLTSVDIHFKIKRSFILVGYWELEKGLNFQEFCIKNVGSIDLNENLQRKFNILMGNLGKKFKR